MTDVGSQRRPLFGQFVKCVDNASSRVPDRAAGSRASPDVHAHQHDGAEGSRVAKQSGRNRRLKSLPQTR